MSRRRIGPVVRRRRIVAGAFVLLAVGSCDGQGSGSGQSPFDLQRGSVKVDTPELRSLKAAAGIAACPGPETGQPVDGGLPSLTLPCLGGGRDVDLAGLRGPLVVNFWSQTCTPCRDEAPLLQELWADAGDTVGVIGVDFYDPRPEWALKFAKAYGLTYPQVADTEAAAKADLRVAALPMTFFVDSSGSIAYTQVGPIDSAEELSDLVREHLGVDVPAAPR